MEGRVKLDLHVHTTHSDGISTVKEILKACRKAGLDGVAITDHDTVSGALEALRIKPRGLIVIPGVEVSTSRGHVVALGVTEPVKSGMTVPETVEAIHDLGGLAVIAHPYDVFRGGMGPRAAEGSGADAVEVMNAMSRPFSICSWLARRLARRLGLPGVAGSDAHSADAVGYGYTVLEAGSGVDDVLDCLRRGVVGVFCRPYPISRRLRNFLRRLRRPSPAGTGLSLR